MPDFSFPTHSAHLDHRRLVEDILSFKGIAKLATLEGKTVFPPLGALARYGDDFLHASPGDHGARGLKFDTASIRELSSQHFGTAFEGRFDISWFLLAIALGRRDLKDSFGQGSFRVDLDAMATWLIFHGIQEHKIAAYLDTYTLRQLCFGNQGQSHLLSPLSLSLARHNARFRNQASRISRFFGAKTVNALAIRVALERYKLTYIQSTTNKDRRGQR